MKTAIGLGLGLDMVPGGGGIDFYSDATVVFDPLNSFYKVGVQSTDSLATFLGYPEVHFSADPTSAISASGFLPDATHKLYVDVTDGGNDEWTIFTEANVVTPEINTTKVRAWCVLGVHDLDDEWWRIGLGQFEFLSIIPGSEFTFSTAPFGSLGRTSLSAESDAVKKTAATVSATNFKGFYGGSVANTQNSASFAGKVFSRFYIGWGGEYQNSMAGDPVLSELPSISYVRTAILQASLNETAAAAWTA
jgi:hypothetical protein